MSRHVVHDEICFPFLSSSISTSSVDPVTFFPSSMPLTTHPPRMPVLNPSFPFSENPTKLEGDNTSDSDSFGVLGSTSDSVEYARGLENGSGGANLSGSSSSVPENIDIDSSSTRDSSCHAPNFVI